MALIQSYLRPLAVVAGIVLGGLVPAGPAMAHEPDGGLGPNDAAAIEEIVRNYLLTHPEVLRDAARALAQQDQEIAAERRRQSMAEMREALINDPNTPVLGNAEGSVTVVEFFDYRCPYCRRVAPDLMQAVAADGDIRLVMKEFPVLGPASVAAARAALASVKQDRYGAFHEALMRAPSGLNENTVLAVAERAGLDLARLKADMAAADVADMIEQNLALAAALQINGTPTFVVGERVVPGAISVDQLRALVAEAREQAAAQ